MNKLPILTAVLAILVAPAVLAGTPAAPEVTDAAGDAPAALDVTAGWFTTGPQTRAAPDRTVIFTWKLADLGLGTPLGDDNAADTRYYYELSFRSSSYPLPVTVRCWIHAVDTSLINHPSSSQMAPGSNCGDVYEGTSIILNTDPSVNVDADTVSVALSRPAAGGIGLAPGTVISAISVKTTGGAATTTLNPALSASAQGTVKDTAAGIKTFTV